MAGIEIKGGKLKTAAEVKGILLHNDQEQRSQRHHRNEHINKDLTQYNIQLGERGSYEETCQYYDDYIARIGGKNKRKDRVTCCSMVLTLPKELSRGVGELSPNSEQYKRASAWFNDAYRCIVDIFGSEKILQYYCHFDENHNYVDSRTGEYETSREHAHVMLIPDVDGRLCAKEFLKRDKLREVLHSVDKMSREKYDVKYVLGTKAKYRDSVEDLKRESAILEEQRKQEENLKELQQQNEALARKNSELLRKNEELEEKQKQLEEKFHKWEEHLKCLQTSEKPMLIKRLNAIEAGERNRQVLPKPSVNPINQRTENIVYGQRGPQF